MVIKRRKISLSVNVFYYQRLKILMGKAKASQSWNPIKDLGWAVETYNLKKTKGKGRWED